MAISEVLCQEFIGQTFLQMTWVGSKGETLVYLAW